MGLIAVFSGDRLDSGHQTKALVWCFSLHIAPQSHLHWSLCIGKVQERQSYLICCVSFMSLYRRELVSLSCGKVWEHIDILSSSILKT